MWKCYTTKVIDRLFHKTIDEKMTILYEILELNMQLITELAPERATEIITKHILLLKKSFIETLVRCLAQSKNLKGT